MKSRTGEQKYIALLTCVGVPTNFFEPVTVHPRPCGFFNDNMKLKNNKKGYQIIFPTGSGSVGKIILASPLQPYVAGEGSGDLPQFP